MRNIHATIITTTNIANSQTELENKQEFMQFVSYQTKDGPGTQLKAREPSNSQVAGFQSGFLLPTKTAKRGPTRRKRHFSSTHVTDNDYWASYGMDNRSPDLGVGS